MPNNVSVYRDEDDTWAVAARVWRGGGWSSYYIRLARSLPTRSAALTEADAWEYDFYANSFRRAPERIAKKTGDEELTPLGRLAYAWQSLAALSNDAECGDKQKERT